MKVLLSIKPEFAFKILEGAKRYEYRRAVFKRNGIRKVLIYASSPISKVVGEFEIAEILDDEPKQLWMKTGNDGGISRERFFHYFSNVSRGYAIKIKKHVEYKIPIPLDQFMVASPPQSFMYLE